LKWRFKTAVVWHASCFNKQQPLTFPHVFTSDWLKGIIERLKKANRPKGRDAKPSPKSIRDTVARLPAEEHLPGADPQGLMSGGADMVFVESFFVRSLFLKVFVLLCALFIQPRAMPLK